MQPGKHVTLVLARDKEHKATVAEITGTGDSLYKRLTLIYGDDKVLEDVPHENDAGEEPKPPYWHERGAARREVMVLAEAPPGEPIPSGVPVGSREPLALPEQEKTERLAVSGSATLRGKK